MILSQFSPSRCESLSVNEKFVSAMPEFAGVCQYAHLLTSGRRSQRPGALDSLAFAG